MRTQDPIACSCGHSGFLKLAENDQPFSDLWMSYTLEGFEGGGMTITNMKDHPKDILSHLNPRCPKCRKTGTVKYVESSA